MAIKTKTLPMNHPGGGYQPVGERSIPKLQKITVRQLMKWAPFIHVDPKLMQRLFLEWEDKRVDSFLTSLYDGTGRCTSLVMAKVEAVLESLKSIKDRQYVEAIRAIKYQIETTLKDMDGTEKLKVKHIPKEIANYFKLDKKDPEDIVSFKKIISNAGTIRKAIADQQK